MRTVTLTTVTATVDVKRTESVVPVINMSDAEGKIVVNWFFLGVVGLVMSFMI